MIAYEELVVALQTWRARQGLPVTQLSGSLTPPPAPPPPKPSTPPAPPAKAAAPPPLAPAPEDSLDVEDAALLDDGHYEEPGENFTLKFGHDVESDAESTNIQAEPATRASDGFGGLTDPNPLAEVGAETETVELPDPKHSVRSTNRNDDW